MIEITKVKNLKGDPEFLKETIDFMKQSKQNARGEDQKYFDAAIWILTETQKEAAIRAS